MLPVVHSCYYTKCLLLSLQISCKAFLVSQTCKNDKVMAFIGGVDIHMTSLFFCVVFSDLFFFFFLVPDFGMF